MGLFELLPPNSLLPSAERKFAKDVRFNYFIVKSETRILQKIQIQIKTRCNDIVIV